MIKDRLNERTLTPQEVRSILKADNKEIVDLCKQTSVLPKKNKEGQLYFSLDEVKKLNFHERNAIYLYYYEQYSVKEIAAIFETKENTVSSWLHRARKQLKEQLKGGWFDEEIR